MFPGVGGWLPGSPHVSLRADLDAERPAGGGHCLLDPGPGAPADSPAREMQVDRSRTRRRPG